MPQASAAQTSPPPRYEVLDTKTPPKSEDAPILAGAWPRFVSCEAIRGIRVHLQSSDPIALVRLVFHLGTKVDPLNSWVRGRTVPDPGQIEIAECPNGTVTERRWLANPSCSTLAPEAVVIELRIPPRAYEHLTLRFPPGAYGLCQIAALADPAPIPKELLPVLSAYPRDLPKYPADRTNLPPHLDPIGEELLSQGEPTLAALWDKVLPFYGPALLGTPEPDGPLAAVTWDGSVILPYKEGEFTRLVLSPDLGPLSKKQAFVRRGLHLGYLPIAEVVSEANEVLLTQTVLLSKGHLHIRLHLENRGATPFEETLRVQAHKGRKIQAENHPHAKVGVYEPQKTPAALRASVNLDLPLRVKVEPKSHLTVDLGMPLSLEEQTTQEPFAQALFETTSGFARFLQGGASLDLPDPHLQNLWRGLCLHNLLFIRGGKMRYGVFPSCYEDAIFGVEEGWNIVALCLYGQGALAQEVLGKTFLDPEFLKKEGQHHQYRNGLALNYTLDVYRLTGDQGFLRRHLPLLKESAAWIEKSLESTRVLEGGKRPAHYGLMPKHTYGGDLQDPAYSLYGSSTCYRGLRDMGILASALSDKDADKYLEGATQARKDMWTTAEAIYKASAPKPFLPFRTDEKNDAPSSKDYYQLFASLILETALFGWNGRFSRAITDYLVESGRLVCGVARFDQWFSRPGIDAEYSRGVQLAHLHRREFDKFYLGLIGQVGLSCDPDTFVSPETAILYFTREDYRQRMLSLSRDPNRHDSEPCSAGTAVILQYLRYALVFEQRDEEDVPGGSIWLFAGAPPSWFKEGVHFAAEGLPVSMGKGAGACTLSFRVETQKGVTKVEIRASVSAKAEIFYYTSGDKSKQKSQIVQLSPGTQIIRL